MRTQTGWGALLAALLLVPGLAVAADAKTGRAKSASCTPCHGPDGISKVPDTPNLAGQPETYLVAQLKAYRSKKRVNDVMNIIAKGLKDADIASLAAWFSSIEVRAEVPK